MITIARLAPVLLPIATSGAGHPGVGSKGGMKVGDQLHVERVTSEVKEPETGRVIRRLTSRVGIVRVADVDELSAVAGIVSGSDFTVSDLVKSAAR